MAIDGIFGTTINLLGKSLDLRVENHNRISANVANAETPSYSPKSLSFESELRDALRTTGKVAAAPTNPRHIPLKGSYSNLSDVRGSIVEDTTTVPGRDGNGVELENEMGKMVQNQIMFNASVQLLSKKFEYLKSAIKGGV